MKGEPFFNKRCRKGALFSAKMAYKRERGWSSGRSLPALNFVKYPSPGLRVPGKVVCVAPLVSFYTPPHLFVGPCVLLHVFNMSFFILLSCIVRRVSANIQCLCWALSLLTVSSHVSVHACFVWFHFSSN